MEPIMLALFSLAFNGLFGVGMYFMKIAHDSTKERLTKTETQIDSIRDHYFKKEDFREFKEELWRRLDKMETSFSTKLHDHELKEFGLINEKN